ncbi:MAG: T9SS type A sorting domain-containing protein [bacterium]|nr:T9SS type A sorting domain-containing protein [bacterium]
MKRLVYVALIFMSIKVCASESSPWGAVIVYPYFPGGVDGTPDPDTQRYRIYNEKLDWAQVCGLSWDRPNSLPGIELSQNNWNFDEVDAAVYIIQKQNIMPLLPSILLPSPWRTDSTSKSDFVRMIVDHYNGDGQGYGTPYKPEMDSLKYPIKYWETVNEPDDRANKTNLNWASVGQLPMRFESLSTDWSVKDSIFSVLCAGSACKDWAFVDSLLLEQLSGFYKYVREIRAGMAFDSTAKLVGPALCSPFSFGGGYGQPWNIYVKDSQNKWGYLNIQKPAEYIWGNILDSVGDCFDVISPHVYALEEDGNEVLNKIDALQTIFIAHNAGNKPVWITETGWEIDSLTGETKQADNYMQLFRGLVQRNWAQKGNKIFFFTLEDFYRTAEWGILDADIIRSNMGTPTRAKPAFDSLQHFIYFNSGQVDFSGFNNQRKLVVDNNTGNLHITNSSWGDIHYAMSTNGGTNWQSFQVVSSNGGAFPAISIDSSSGINICWVESGKVKFRRKATSNWDTIINISPDTGSYSQIAPPSMVVDGNNNVHIIVEHYTGTNGGYQTVYVDYCKFNLSSFTVTTTCLDSFSQWTGDIRSPSISLYGNIPNVCWERRTSSPYDPEGVKEDIYYRRCSGGNWSPGLDSMPFLVSDSSGKSDHPAIDAHDGFVRIVYEKNNGISERVRNYDGSWRNEVVISNSGSAPQVYGATVVWADNGNIYGSGGAVQGTQLLNTSYPGHSGYPQIAIKTSGQEVLYYAYTNNGIPSYDKVYEMKVGKKEGYIWRFINPINQTTTIPEDAMVWCSGNTVIDSGVTVTLNRGTRFCCMSSDSEQGKLTINGNLIANSTIFTSDTAFVTDSIPKKWHGIEIAQGGNAEIRGCEIKNAGCAIRTNGNLLCQNNTITNNDTGIYVNSNASSVCLGNLSDNNVNNDGMNSIYQNECNLYNATNDSIMAQACYWGSFNPDSLKITGSVSYEPFGYDCQNADWTIANDTTIYGTYWNVGTFKINSGKTAKVAPKSINTTGWIAIEADSFDIQGTFSADSAGYLAGEGTGAGTIGASAYGAGGAGYGGRGGAGGCNLQGDTSKYGGFAYGNLENPCDMGSGGGNADATYKGGAGGGIIRLISSGTINVAGTIKSDGKNGATNGGLKSAGGGSGGSVWLQTNKLTGNGLISCKGGNGSNGSSADGGAGSGGRLNVWYQQSSFTGRVDVSGGLSYDNAQTGQMGTALIHQTDDSVKIILSPVQTLSSTDSRYGFVKGIEFTDKYIRLTSGDSIVGNFRARARDSIIVNTSSYILADEKGYAHNQGTGYGHYGSSSHGAGGAGYGNLGGWGSYHTQGGVGDGGIAYPDSFMPDSLGSGGGDFANVSGYRYGGGNGGGLIELQCGDSVSGTIILNGTLSVNGSNGTSQSGYAGGGASGGSVLLFAKYLKGSGVVNAKGGDGGSISNCKAGGGAGGRVMFYRDSLDTTTTITVSVAGGDSGGTGATPGKIGTFKQDVLPSEFVPVSYVNNAGLPFVFKMFQNFPNPFRNKTTIKYQIPLTSKVSLMLYDLTGRCVKTLVDEEQLPGYYKAELNSKDYPTGIYFAKFSAKGGSASGGKAGDYKETRKLILMK